MSLSQKGIKLIANPIVGQIMKSVTIEEYYEKRTESDYSLLH